MVVTVTDGRMTSDATPHYAELARLAGEGWRVSWLPDRLLSRNDATTAMVLAEYVDAGISEPMATDWPLVDGLAAELGLSGTEVVTMVGAPVPGVK
jgi:hypothetical protein